MKKILLSAICIILSFSVFAQGQQGIAKNIILLIGDGMGVSHVYAGMVASEKPLNIEQFRHIGFQKTNSGDAFVTDSGASGTALATGHKTYNGAIGVDMDKNPVKSILEYAEDHGKATGLVATSTITHATPASFISHQASRHDYENIAADFLKTEIEVFIGGGLRHFNQRADKTDLTAELEKRGYHMVYELEGLNKIKSGKIAGLLYEEAPPPFSKGREDMLPVSTQKSIEILSQDDNGFFLMVEGSQIDWAGHDNDIDYIIGEVHDFDNAVGIALAFAEKEGNTLVIVTADHETGGLGINGGNLKENKIKAGFTTGAHTGVMVPVFAFGPGAEAFQGIYDNTDVFKKMMKVFGFSVNCDR